MRESERRQIIVVEAYLDERTNQSVIIIEPSDPDDHPLPGGIEQCETLNKIWARVTNYVTFIVTNNCPPSDTITICREILLESLQSNRNNLLGLNLYVAIWFEIDGNNVYFYTTDNTGVIAGVLSPILQARFDYTCENMLGDLELEISSMNMD